jgi:hypothetical protein
MIEYPFRTFETRDKPQPAWNRSRYVQILGRMSMKSQNRLQL